MTDQKDKIIIKKALLLETKQRTEFLGQLEEGELKEKVKLLLGDEDELTQFVLKTSAASKVLEKHQLKDLVSGDRIKQFVIIKLIAKGGMGSVYLAYDDKLKRNVAIKTIRSEYIQNKATQQRFKQEAQILSQINHPSICQIYEYIDYDDGDLLVLELVKGVTLNNTNLDDQEKLGAFIQIASALEVAHNKGVIHRDLKPDNIMCSNENEIKVLDFGIAKSKTVGMSKPNLEEIKVTNHDKPLTKMGTLMGTLLYMSPEQAAGKEVTTFSDIYSFGIIMQEILTGVTVYDLANTEDLKQQVIEAKTVNCDLIPKEYQEIISSIVQRSPNQRPSASKVQQSLQEIKDLPVARKRKKRKTLVALIVLLMFSFIIYQWYEFSQRQKKSNFINSVTTEITEIRNRINTIFTLPKHNIRPEWDLLDEQSDAIIKRLKINTKIQLAQKNLLIGNAYFVVRDFKKSIKYLEKAWSLGIKTPELAYRLGYNFMTVFNDSSGYRSIWQADSDEDLKKKNSKTLQNSFDKALLYFDFFHSDNEEYTWMIQIYKLLINKQYAKALNLVDIEKLHKNADYENFNLVGSIYQNIMSEKAKIKDFDAVEKNYLLSFSYYKNAIDYARSYPMPYKHICNLITERLEISIFASHSSYIKQINDIKHYCTDALEIYPSNKRMINELVAFYTRYAEYMVETGADAQEPLKEAISLSDKIINKGCKSYGSSGILYDLLAEQEFNSGASPVASVKNALKAYQNSLEDCPEEITLVTGNMFYSYMILLKYQISQGIYPSLAMNKAKVILLKQQNSPYKRMDVHGNMSSNYGDLLRLMAYSSLQHDKNPIQWLDQAQYFYNKSIQSEGRSPYPYGGLAGVDLLYANYDLLKGVLTQEKMGNLHKSIDEALEISENLAWIVLMKADTLRLEYLRDRNLLTFKRADQNFVKSINMNVKNFDAHIHRAQLMLDAILQKSTSPERRKYHDIASQEIEFVLQLVPNHVEAKKVKALLEKEEN